MRAVGKAEITEAALRLMEAGASRRRLVPGVSVVTVTWNTREYLAAQLAAIDQFTEVPVAHITVDNASTDGTRDWLRGENRSRVIPLPRNVGHALGLHVGIAAVRTSMFVVMDVDAFPISDGWLAALVGPLRSGQLLVGADVHGWAHPCCLAARTDWFFARRRRLATIGSIPDPAFRDVGQHFAEEAAKEGGVTLLRRTGNLGPGVVGSVFGGVVYHNFYSAHGQGEGAGKDVTAESVEAAWHRAVTTFLPRATV